MKKRNLSLALALTLILTLVPILAPSALAADTIPSITIKIPGSDAVFTLENVSPEYVIAKDTIARDYNADGTYVERGGVPDFRFAFPGKNGKISCDTSGVIFGSYREGDADMLMLNAGPIFPYEVSAVWSHGYNSWFNRDDLTLNGSGHLEVIIALDNNGVFVDPFETDVTVAKITFSFGFPFAPHPDDLVSYQRIGHVPYNPPNSQSAPGASSEFLHVNLPKHPVSELSVDASPNAPDTWAVEEVNAALAAGLVPDSIANAGWKNPTSRLAAADTIVLLIEKASVKTMTQLSSEKGWNLNSGGFSDTNSQAVTFLKHAGVTSGVGDNRYDPNGQYTRAQIVTMIGRAAEAFFGATAQGVNPFTDVPDWASPYVGYAANNGITQGVGGGKFDSDGVLQNQHTAVFAYRTFNLWKLSSVEIAAGIKLASRVDMPFDKEVIAAPGDVLRVQMQVRNTGTQAIDIAVRAVLPEGVSYVEDSTRLYNNTNPDGLAIRDLTEWRNLGDYRPYDGEYGAATIHYEVEIGDILADEAVSISNQAAGYINGNVVTDTHVYYITVNVR